MEEVAPVEVRLREAQAALRRQLLACINMLRRGSAAQRYLAEVALGLAYKAVRDLEAKIRQHERSTGEAECPLSSDPAS